MVLKIQMGRGALINYILFYLARGKRAVDGFRECTEPEEMHESNSVYIYYIFTYTPTQTPREIIYVYKSKNKSILANIY